MNAIQEASFQTLKLLLDGVLKRPVNLLWPDRKIDEEFAKRFLDTGFDMLKHNQSSTKVEDNKEVLFDILQTCMSTFGGEIKNMMNTFI